MIGFCFFKRFQRPATVPATNRTLFVQRSCNISFVSLLLLLLLNVPKTILPWCAQFNFWIFCKHRLSYLITAFLVSLFQSSVMKYYQKCAMHFLNKNQTHEPKIVCVKCMQNGLFYYFNKCRRPHAAKPTLNNLFIVNI